MVSDFDKTVKSSGLEAAPDIVIDGFYGVNVVAGLVKLNLYNDYFNPTSDKFERRFVAKLAVSSGSLIQMVKGLNELIDQMVRDGAIALDEGKNDETQ